MASSTAQIFFPQPCDSCGKSIDTLRASSVLCFEDGFRYFCHTECKSRYLRGERHSSINYGSGRISVRSSSISLKAVPSPPQGNREQLLSPILTSENLSQDLPSNRLIVFGIILAVIAGLTGGLHTHSYVRVLSVALNIASACIALHSVWQTPFQRQVSLLAGPMGVVFVALSAFGSPIASMSCRATLIGAGLMACAMLLRCLIQRDSNACVTDRLNLLLVPLPTEARIPTEDHTGSVRIAQSPVSVQSLRIGDEIVVSMGETVPTDGIVTAGQAIVTPFPNASASVSVGQNDSVIAGASVIEGALRIVVTATRQQRTLVRALHLQPAENGTAGWLQTLQNILQRWSMYVLGALCLVALIANAGISARLHAIGVLLAVTPLLALDRSIFLPLLAATISAASRGVFFKNRRSLFKAGAVGVVGMRSRGIVTEGHLEVVELKVFSNDPVESLLKIVVAAEDPFVGHPIANALLRFAELQNVTARAALSSNLREGRGIVGTTNDGTTFVIGNRQLLLNKGISAAVAEEELKQAESLGRTVVLFAVNDRIQALFALQDEPSPHARVAVQRLVDMDMEVVLLSGDHRRTVETIANHLGIDHVKAELPSDERTQEVRRLHEAGNVVSIVGHPIQDEAQLSAADIPIVLASAGRGLNLTDNIMLVSKDLRDAADALWIAKATRQAIRRAFWVVGCMGMLCTLVAVFGQLSAIGAAVVVLSLDLYALPKAQRLLRRIDLRVPLRSW